MTGDWEPCGWRGQPDNWYEEAYNQLCEQDDSWPPDIRSVLVFENSKVDPVTVEDKGELCYYESDGTVRRTSPAGPNGTIAGAVIDADEAGVHVTLVRRRRDLEEQVDTLNAAGVGKVRLPRRQSTHEEQCKQCGSTEHDENNCPPLTCAHEGCEAMHPNAPAGAPGSAAGWRCHEHEKPEPEVGQIWYPIALGAEFVVDAVCSVDRLLYMTGIKSGVQHRLTHSELMSKAVNTDKRWENGTALPEVRSRPWQRHVGEYEIAIGLKGIGLSSHGHDAVSLEEIQEATRKALDDYINKPKSEAADGELQ
jgi:hypothetical protein